MSQAASADSVLLSTYAAPHTHTHTHTQHRQQHTHTHTHTHRHTHTHTHTPILCTFQNLSDCWAITSAPRLTKEAIFLTKAACVFVCVCVCECVYNVCVCVCVYNVCVL